MTLNYSSSGTDNLAERVQFLEYENQRMQLEVNRLNRKVAYYMVTASISVILNIGLILTFSR